LRNTLTLVCAGSFNLRGCRAFTPGEADYRHCLYAHLKYCTAPCIGNVTREQYREQVRAAGDFLAGQCREMKEQLETEMKKAAAARDYEKAAGLRDLIRDLKETTKKERKFERTRYTLPMAIDPQRDLAELAKVLACPRRRSASRVSTLEHQRHVCRGVAGQLQARPAPTARIYRRFKIKTVEGQDDFGRHGRGGAPAVTARLLNESRVESRKPRVSSSEFRLQAATGPAEAGTPNHKPARPCFN